MAVGESGVVGVSPGSAILYPVLKGLEQGRDNAANRRADEAAGRRAADQVPFESLLDLIRVVRAEIDRLNDRHPRFRDHRRLRYLRALLKRAEQRYDSDDLDPELYEPDLGDPIEEELELRKIGIGVGILGAGGVINPRRVTEKQVVDRLKRIAQQARRLKLKKIGSSNVAKVITRAAGRFGAIGIATVALEQIAKVYEKARVWQIERGTVKLSKSAEQRIRELGGPRGVKKAIAEQDRIRKQMKGPRQRLGPATRLAGPMAAATTNRGTGVKPRIQPPRPAAPPTTPAVARAPQPTTRAKPSTSPPARPMPKANRVPPMPQGQTIPPVVRKAYEVIRRAGQIAPLFRKPPKAQPIQYGNIQLPSPGVDRLLATRASLAPQAATCRPCGEKRKRTAQKKRQRRTVKKRGKICINI